MNINMSNSSVNINGISIDVRNGRVYVNNKLYGPVDGAVPETPNVSKTLELDKDGRVVGDIHGDLVVRGLLAHPITVFIQGNVDGSVNCDGSVTCDKIGGSVTAGGDVRTSQVGGSANAGGDIRAMTIGGSANAGGGIFR